MSNQPPEGPVPFAPQPWAPAPGADGPPPHPVAPSGPPPAGRMFSPNAVGIATFLGSPIAGGILIAWNYRTMGKAMAPLVAVIAGIAATAGIFGIAIAAGDALPNALGFVVPFAALGIAKLLQGDAHLAHLGRGGREASSWLAAGIALPFLAVIGWGIFTYGMLPDLGAKVGFGHDQDVYYKDGVTRDQAKQTGELLKQVGFFDNTGAKTVMTRKASDGHVVVGFVVRSGVKLEGPVEQAFTQIRNMISAQVFDGGAVEIELVKDNLKVIDKLPPPG